MSPPIAAGLMSYVAELLGFDPASEQEISAPESLTGRERDVLNPVQQCLTNQGIAELLVIELGTVKNHVDNILRKLNVNSRRDAVHVSRLAGLRGLNEINAKGNHGPSGRKAQRPLYSPTLGAST